MRGGKLELKSPKLSDPSYTRSFKEPAREARIADDKFCVLADLLIPGRGEPIENGCVIVEGTKITYAGGADDATPQYGELPTTRVKVVMPGMWDCHVHLLGLQKLDVSEFVKGAQNQALIGARCAKDAMLLLNAGFTSVRELAGYGIQVAQAIEEGTIVGPKIYSANHIISTTGGHADVHSMHKAWYDDACSHGMPMCTADGVPECLKAVRMQLREGAKVIKICASGGVASELDDPVHQQFGEEEMRAMVEEAARAERIVAAHCHGKPGITAALRAGVKTIEHGSFLDEEVADLMIEKDAILVATRLIVENGLAMKDFFAPYAYKKLLKVANAHWSAMQLAIKKGVKMAIGTDTTGTIPGSDSLSFGVVGKELWYHVKAGMTPLQAIEAATVNSAQTLGPQAPKAGLLKKGFDADFIALDENPLEDIQVLGDSKHVTHVWKQGRCCKCPSCPIFTH